MQQQQQLQVKQLVTVVVIVTIIIKKTNVVIQTTSIVYYLSPQSFRDIVILQLHITRLTVFCTMNACLDGKINHASNAYFIDIQAGATIFSSCIQQMTIYFRGHIAGNKLKIYCNENDSRAIDCCKIGMIDTNGDIVASNGCNQIILYIVLKNVV